jgi:mutator protein MutT
MRIVTAAIMEERGRIFIARRKEGKNLSGKWEFPGGKMERGETPEEALTRELEEELGLRVAVGELLCSVRFRSGTADYELHAYRVTRSSGAPVLREHDEARWVLPSRLLFYDLAESDRRVVERLFGS